MGRMMGRTRVIGLGEVDSAATFYRREKTSDGRHPSSLPSRHEPVGPDGLLIYSIE